MCFFAPEQLNYLQARMKKTEAALNHIFSQGPMFDGTDIQLISGWVEADPIAYIELRRLYRIHDPLSGAEIAALTETGDGG
jgi:hypothetical protein